MFARLFKPGLEVAASLASAGLQAAAIHYLNQATNSSASTQTTPSVPTNVTTTEQKIPSQSRGLGR